jgi:hypothetical protein
MARASSMNGAKRNAYRILVGKAEGKRPLGRPRRRWLDTAPCGRFSQYDASLRNAAPSMFFL